MKGGVTMKRVSAAAMRGSGGRDASACTRARASAKRPPVSDASSAVVSGSALGERRSMSSASSGAHSSCQRRRRAASAAAWRLARRSAATSVAAPFVAGVAGGAGIGGAALAGTGSAAPVVAPSSSATSPVSSRGVCSDMPSAPFVAEIPAPEANLMRPRSAVTSVIGTRFVLATQAVPSCFGASSTATSHSFSSGGRTVTRNSRPPPRSGSSALLLDVYRSSGRTWPTAAPFAPASKTALLTIARRSAMRGGDVTACARPRGNGPPTA